jgi:hypothetical protein
VNLAHTLVAAVACILLVVLGCHDSEVRRGNLIAAFGAAGIVFVALT